MSGHDLILTPRRKDIRMSKPNSSGQNDQVIRKEQIRQQLKDAFDDILFPFGEASQEQNILRVRQLSKVFSKYPNEEKRAENALEEDAINLWCLDFLRLTPEQAQ